MDKYYQSWSNIIKFNKSQAPIFELHASHRSVKTRFNTIFPISSLSFFFLPFFCNFCFRLRLGFFWFFLKLIVLKSDFFRKKKKKKKKKKRGLPLIEMSGSASGTYNWYENKNYIRCKQTMLTRVRDLFFHEKQNQIITLFIFCIL